MKYKAFTKDLTCIDFQYEIGKTYEMEYQPIICERDSMLYRFGRCLVIMITERNQNLEVELLGDVEDDNQEDSKVATKIKIVRELTTKDLLQLGTVGAITHLTAIGSGSLSDEAAQ